MAQPLAELWDRRAANRNPGKHHPCLVGVDFRKIVADAAAAQTALRARAARR